MLVGKQFYLRNGYLGDTLNFDERGRIVSHSPRGSYTLSIVQIDHVRLTKHKVELEGTRYGLHFNEQLAYEDSSKAYDQVRITPNKKVVRITFDREMVVSPKKKKEPVKEKGITVKLAVAITPTPGSAPATVPASAATAAVTVQLLHLLRHRARRLHPRQLPIRWLWLHRLPHRHHSRRRRPQLRLPPSRAR